MAKPLDKNQHVSWQFEVGLNKKQRQKNEGQKIVFGCHARKKKFALLFFCPTFFCLPLFQAIPNAP
jgi:hypothetical protein